MAIPLKRRKEYRRLPYGRWTCADGRVVLFNRGYKPLWARRPGGPIEQMRGDEWIEHIVGEEWFYADGNPPWRDYETRRRCLEVLTQFGIRTTC